MTYSGVKVEAEPVNGPVEILAYQPPIRNRIHWFRPSFSMWWWAASFGSAGKLSADDWGVGSAAQPVEDSVGNAGLCGDLYKLGLGGLGCCDAQGDGEW